MSMFMASMRNAQRDGELDGMGMFGATLKRDIAEYESRLVALANGPLGATASPTPDAAPGESAALVVQQPRDEPNPPATPTLGEG